MVQVNKMNANLEQGYSSFNILKCLLEKVRIFLFYQWIVGTLISFGKATGIGKGKPEEWCSGKSVAHLYPIFLFLVQ